MAWQDPSLDLENVNAAYREAQERIALLEKGLRHYRFGPRGWAARLALAGGDVGIDPQRADESAGGPFEWEFGD